VTLLQRLLLLPLLSPLLALLLLGAVNPRPWVALRLLTWVSPAWPLGIWISAAAAAGAGLSAAGTALALQAGDNAMLPRRQVRRRSEEPNRSPEADDSPWPASEAEVPGPAWAGPGRAAGEPAPTVSVPFRVIRRGQGAAPSAPAAAPAAATSAAPAGSGVDDWASGSGDDW